MAKFRKKPVVIEAVQWTGDGFDSRPLPEWLVHAIGELIVQPKGADELTVRTLEGDHTARPGDWIMRGVKGELYPCKPDIFALTYEPVED